jgi:hypothetical protein
MLSHDANYHPARLLRKKNFVNLLSFFEVYFGRTADTSCRAFGERR